MSKKSFHWEWMNKMGVTDKANIFAIAQHGDYETFLKKFHIDDLNTKSEFGASLLHHAIAGRNFEIALFLIHQNIDVNMTDSEGQTALHLICVNPNIEVAKEILKKGGNINLKDKYGNNAMWTAVFNCKGMYYDMVELFMQYSPDILSKNNVGRSPLDMAYRRGYEKLINILNQKP